MFTGIVQGMARVVAIERLEGLNRHVIDMPPAMLEGLAHGASVAHNGCCLSVTSIEGSRVGFDLMRETLALTNLGALEVNDYVNVERAARLGDEVGGHAMSGHVMCMATLITREDAPNNCRLWFELPQQWARFLFDKGYIGVDGISLTIGEVQDNRFCVNLIPDTLARTVIGTREIGDGVNIEIDPQTQTIVETVERVLAARA
ncbi:riboflavin synthase subunit alpha [Kushneria marisflavi]|uniref:Riboflavin synthase n=1 Tax=Kushneria marisflavi TaxID=157779 RepID=A0A240UTB3_9GAMM|nr:riboflavin synthase subunit alpha [Kushneria marisflavi]ART64376.1 riboflavin synthase [Kushneria marisflavi]RKD76847.1 riboflavin synthase alpha chain [Kushneria marisflavi]